MTMVIRKATGDNNALAWFIELYIRNYAKGSSNTAVLFVEGWYIDEEVRGRGHGRRLMQTAEQGALDNGYDELASDTEMENTDSIAAHSKLKFKEVGRFVCFIKKLK